MAIVTVPVGAKKVEMELVVLSVDGTPREVRKFVWHANPFIHFWMQIVLFAQRLWARVVRAAKFVWSKVWPRY